MKDTIEILVVDDKPENIKVVGGLLRNNGYDVRAATSGQAAINGAEFSPPDLILLDVSMPEMDGYETCRRFKTIKNIADVPVLFMTAEKHGPESFVEGIQAGAVDFIEKPVDPSILLARIGVHVALRRIQVELIERNAYLQKLNEWKTRLISILSHDLRNPVSGFGSLADLLVEDYESMDDNTRKECLIELRNSGYNTFEMLDNILNWVRTTNDDLIVISEPFSLNETIASVMNQFASATKRKSVHLIAEADENLMAIGDINITTTVLRNLLSNAVKFSKSGGRITITAKTEDDSVVITVADDGIGMSPERLAGLFSDKVESRRGTQGEVGTGLGLSMCRDLMQRQGGIIDASSFEGVGSIFRVSLPSAPKSKQETKT